MSEFTERLADASGRFGRICVGLDPSKTQLNRWGLSDDLSGLQTFSELVVRELSGRVGLVKPQVSFFERFGSEGISVLEGLMHQLSEGGAFVIADAKRGDIGSTMLGYVQGWLGSSGRDADALTVHSFLGMEVVAECLHAADLPEGKGVFALCATSNPEGSTIQKAMIGDRTLAKYLFDEAERLTANEAIEIGVVIGATLNLADYGLDDLRFRCSEVPILAPGFGAQGANLSQLTATYGDSAPAVIPSMSRELLGDNPSGLGSRISKANESLA